MGGTALVSGLAQLFSLFGLDGTGYSLAVAATIMTLVGPYFYTLPDVGVRFKTAMLTFTWCFDLMCFEAYHFAEVDEKSGNVVVPFNYLVRFALCMNCGLLVSAAVNFFVFPITAYDDLNFLLLSKMVGSYLLRHQDVNHLLRK